MFPFSLCYRNNDILLLNAQLTQEKNIQKLKNELAKLRADFENYKYHSQLTNEIRLKSMTKDMLVLNEKLNNLQNNNSKEQSSSFLPKINEKNEEV